MQAKLAIAPNTGITTCLMPWNISCSRKATIQMMFVRPYTAKVPKFETSVTSESPFGSDDSIAFEFIPSAYQIVCGRDAMVLSSGAAEPAKKKIAAYAPITAEIVARVQIARCGVRFS